MRRQIPAPISLLCLLAVLLCPLGARAQLVAPLPITPATQAVSDWYGALPPAFRAGDRVTLELLGDRDMDRYLKSVGLEDGTAGAVVDGGDGLITRLYAERQSRLTLRLDPAGAFSVLVLTHEWGHFVWFHLLSKDDRGRYREIYKRQSQAGHLVSRYARTSLEEGFAEAFGFYALHPDRLQGADAASFGFLHDWEAHHAQ